MERALISRAEALQILESRLEQPITTYASIVLTEIIKEINELAGDNL